ncbi:GNAT family N-acetyltransferase [Brevibacillus ruminantium]|uniref:GNAT family N-acetyltransferase n=1 Tax=Brevibacillus ruminantium TaxID=2950604 RepID=A0ABY4WRG5_9BACL|nr:GNAT family protein [Brevibacillus ruminantium]USG68485.1 GNAT family N-acetyltransferase [Brevibacillus ruminantium]
MHLTQMTEKDVNEIITWKYPEPYSFYDFEDSEETIQELMDGTYFAVHDESNQLIGFFCYGGNAQVPGGRKYGLYTGEHVLDIGLGMKPELTGQGEGFSFLEAGIRFAAQKYSPRFLRLSVASFNERAFRLYSKMGFTETASFLNHDREFIIMSMDVSTFLKN